MARQWQVERQARASRESSTPWWFLVVVVSHTWYDKRERFFYNSMCPTQKSCADCHRLGVGYVIQHETDKMLLCRLCFLQRCMSIVEKGEYPPGATMDDFRQQMLEVRVGGALGA